MIEIKIGHHIRRTAPTRRDGSHGKRARPIVAIGIDRAMIDHDACGGNRSNNRKTYGTMTMLTANQAGIR